MPPRARSHLWGWTPRARILLAALSLMFAVILATNAPRDRQAPAIDSTLIVDPNSAPPEVLSALPRLGPAMVRRIVAERERAPFRSLDDFDQRVRGLGPVTIALIRPHLCFVGERPGPPAQKSTIPLAANSSRHDHD